MLTLLAVYAFVLGALIGSFLNVVIYRYPSGESIVFPSSKCPSCRTPIRWFDNVPVASWLVLRGRCRACRAPIDVRYPLVELSNALLYLAIFLRTGVSYDFVPLAAIASMLIVLIYIDLDIQILPDVIDLPGIAIGLLVGWMQIGERHPDLVVSSSFLDSALGAILGGGLLFSAAYLYKVLRHVEGMGLGDVKMLAMLGAIVGWEAILPLLFIASFFGAIIGLSIGLRRDEGLRYPVPFGVFLGLAAFAVLFFGNTLHEWYFSLLLR